VIAAGRKHYVFFVREALPKAGADLVQIVHLANAAANLGYSTVLVHLAKEWREIRPFDFLHSFRPQRPSDRLTRYYNLQDRLKIATLPMPYPIDRIGGKLANSSTIACKYYLPFHLSRHAQLVHSRDWNFVKAAIKNGIAAIYERDHYENKRYDPEIVNSPLLQATVTVAETVKEDLIRNGMPADKILTLHNGFNQLFWERQPEAARAWRSQLLADRFHHLVVYAGELAKFKGIDLLIDIAPQLPEVKFALAGGTDAQLQAYQQILWKKQVTNITLVGYLQHDRLASLLQAADVLVYPHLSGEAASFTSPMKLFDYIAAGNPIVATRIPPLREFETSPLVDGWCEPDNPSEFSRCLQAVLQKYPRWTADHIRDRALVQQFSWENRITKTLERVAPAVRPPAIL